MDVAIVPREAYAFLLLDHHYAKRIPSISHAFCLKDAEAVIGVVTFGSPASRSVQKGACPVDPSRVIELNRLCVLDCAPRNTESWFLSRALKLLPPYIVVSYADTAQGHQGIVYRAANFYYAGWTDMDRKTPRFDYVVPGKHSRSAFRGDTPSFTARVRRLPKVKYWTLTGNRKERHALSKLCVLPRLDWSVTPPPGDLC